MGKVFGACGFLTTFLPLSPWAVKTMGLFLCVVDNKPRRVTCAGGQQGGLNLSNGNLRISVRAIVNGGVVGKRRSV